MADTKANETTYTDVFCHCKSSSFRVPFLKASLPIENDLCHCNICRHCTGQMALYYVRTSGGPHPLTTSNDNSQLPQETKDFDKTAALFNLVEYRTSPVAARYFCKTCGAHMLWRQDSTWLLDDKGSPANREIAKKFGIDLGDGDGYAPGVYWCVGAGVLSRIEGKVGFHIFVEDTLDGGIMDHFHNGFENLDRWSTWPNSRLLPRNWKAPNLMSSRGDEDRLHFYCQCRGVELYVTRPSSSVSPDKFPARHCECESCKRTTGFEVVSWGRVPVQNIYDKKTQNVIDFGGGLPVGMKEYTSSVGTRRYFCASCGASVFLYGFGPLGVVDLAIGLVDEEQGGARAEGWFGWTGTVG